MPPEVYFSRVFSAMLRIWSAPPGPNEPPHPPGLVFPRISLGNTQRNSIIAGALRARGHSEKPTRWRAAGAVGKRGKAVNHHRCRQLDQSDPGGVILNVGRTSVALPVTGVRFVIVWRRLWPAEPSADLFNPVPLTTKKWVVRRAPVLVRAWCLGSIHD